MSTTAQPGSAANRCTTQSFAQKVNDILLKGGDKMYIMIKKYYVSYYIGPEGGASKEIQIEKKNEGWAVVNDDGMWNVK